MFVRGLLTLLEAEGRAIVRTPNCTLGISYTSWDYDIWHMGICHMHMALMTGVNVAPRPGPTSPRSWSLKLVLGE